MAPDDGQSQEVDLDRTDRLPVLGGSADDDVADDAVRLEFAPVAKSVKSEYRRRPPAEPPSLAASVRSVEERIARRNAEYEALTQAHADAQASQAEAAARAAALAAELGAVRATLESEQARSRELGKTLAARDAAILQLTHSLAERDGQLSALQREHAQIVPTLEQRSTAAVQLEADLTAAGTQLAALNAELDRARRAVATLTEQAQRREEELLATRRDLNVAQAQAAAHLERLRTREFRRALGDGSLPAGHAELQSALSAQEAQRAKSETRVQELQLVCTDLTARVGAAGQEAQRAKEMLSAAEQSRADLALEVLRLRAEAQEQEGQMEVLLAHLQEARRLIGRGDAEPRRASGGPASGGPASGETAAGETAAKSGPTDQPPGRIRTAGATVAAAPPESEYTADLIRTDDGSGKSYALGRRNRIGRAPGCELHIDSSSVSRHHALVLTNARDVVVEDQNSTNGVFVNGRKVSRWLLTDGDVLTIGEAQFRLRLQSGPREARAAEPAAR